MKYDLEERVSKSGGMIIDFVKQVNKTDVTRPLLDQLISSGTSVGANYMEANDASSKKDFRNKIRICGKESRETKYWVRMIVHSDNSISERSVKRFGNNHMS
jgi:four helix bundle protein